jgi:hypothetical protein
MTRNRKAKAISANDHIEAAIASLIKSGQRGMLDHAAWLAEKLPERRARKALRMIVAAI